MPALGSGVVWSLGENTDELFLSHASLEDHRPFSTTSSELEWVEPAKISPAGRQFKYDISDNRWETSVTPELNATGVSSIANIRSQAADLGYIAGGKLNVLEGVGKEGILIFLGTGTKGSTSDASLKERSFRSIQVYDIASERWFSQATTGDLGAYPPERGAPAPSPHPRQTDRPTTSTFLAGGIAPPTPICFDVWVLSLPYFHWTEIRTYDGDRIGRSGMTCEAVGEGNRYMFVFGGFVGGAGLGNESVCGVIRPGQLLDLTTGEWDNDFEVERRWEVPEAVYPMVQIIPGGFRLRNFQFQIPRTAFPGLHQVFCIYIFDKFDENTRTFPRTKL
ncbi:hypothetical protein BJ508DRAFT_333017 [Ascobolus immersus RN42]|uniref:Galactose oxidase n=1 Tax=Ascobolus immersus RN42 TaxID=1160509 RepID=A0A3N4HNK4_ASCIM|nr:hypothetical protein BJ508DRAFT_333017 [Ascobolus immersus RN42]